MPQVSRLRLFILVALTISLVAAGCVRAAEPRGWAPPVETGNIVLVTPTRGKLDAVNRNNGDRLWRFPDDWEIGEDDARDTEGIYAEPIIIGTRAFVADYNGYVYALDMSAQPSGGSGGRVLWTKKPGGPIVGGMTLDSTTGTLFVASDDGHIYGLQDAATADSGSTFRDFLSTPERIWSAPAAANGRVYVSGADGRLYALDARTAETVWSFAAGGALISTPVVTSSLVLAGGFDGTLYAVGIDSGEEVWRMDTENWVWAKPLVESAVDYAADFDGKVQALNLNDGSPIWQAPFEAKDSIRSAMVMAGSVLVVVTDSGTLYGLDPRTGSRTWGPVEVGSQVNADLRLASSPPAVFMAPKQCTSQEQSESRVYFYGVDGAQGALRATDKVC